MPPLFRRVGRVAAACSAFVAAAVHAQPAVEVTGVRFTSLPGPSGAAGNWIEADVVLNVRPSSDNAALMVSRVRVALLVGFEVPVAGSAERRIEHFRSDAECVALDAGRADVRFYLPPEMVRRDQLRIDPRYWGVELAIGGHAQAAAKTAYSTTLATPDTRKNFQTRGGSAAEANDGIMVPQYLTPFVFEYPRATPSFVRREGR